MPFCLHPTAPLHRLHNCRGHLLAQDVLGVAWGEVVALVEVELVGVLVVASAEQSALSQGTPWWHTQHL